MKKQALILIDIQNDYFSGGKMELHQMEAAAENAARLLSFFRKMNWPVVHIQHHSAYPGAFFFVPETTGVEIHPSVFPLNNETVVVKYFPNSFRQTNLLDILKSQAIDELVICGAMSHICVDTTTRAAFDFGYPVTLIHDACATCDLMFNGTVVESQKVQAAYMGALNGIFARVIATSEFIQE